MGEERTIYDVGYDIGRGIIWGDMGEESTINDVGYDIGRGYRVDYQEKIAGGHFRV
ncbi:Hypothetical protein CINCED_3A010460 [Cinara cedri]|uniref:Uncharacterized protein n=1 Tax=Cinara cedri TaxID=506608 RepID=A0A5E4N077_9HEMI|nr:Hypothetical protein CINCED_3A010460 [Cinara cedri]